ncbi:MAG: 6-phosphogluconolactonase, partial [Terriglobales bacterium]
ANADYWGGGYRPTHAVTVGLATILDARCICLLVRGAGKAAPLRRALLEPANDAVPASYLRRAPRLVVLADPDAASQLPGGPCHA